MMDGKRMITYTCSFYNLKQMGETKINLQSEGVAGMEDGWHSRTETQGMAEPSREKVATNIWATKI